MVNEIRLGYGWSVTTDLRDDEPVDPALAQRVARMIEEEIDRMILFGAPEPRPTTLRSGGRSFEVRVRRDWWRNPGA